MIWKSERIFQVLVAATEQTKCLFPLSQCFTGIVDAMKGFEDGLCAVLCPGAPLCGFLAPTGVIESLRFFVLFNTLAKL